MGAYDKSNALKEADNTISVDEGEPLTYDLSRDVDVNKYVPSSAIDPDAELIDKNLIAHKRNNKDDEDLDLYKRYDYRLL